MGWNLLSVILVFVAYGWLGPAGCPAGSASRASATAEFIEIMTMAGHGVFGITTETSLNARLLFPRVQRGVSATVGGTELFMDIALKAGRHAPGRRRQGGGRRRARCSAPSRGSAVANVTATGIVHHPADDAHRLRPRNGGRARGDRVDRRAADAAGDGHRGLRHGRACSACRTPRSRSPRRFRRSPTTSVALSARATSRRCARGSGSLPAADIDAIAADLRRAHALIMPPLIADRRVRAATIRRHHGGDDRRASSALGLRATCRADAPLTPRASWK